MKKNYIIILAMSIYALAGAHRLDLKSLSEIRQEGLKKNLVEHKSKANINGLFTPQSISRSTSLAFITLADGFTASDLRKEGVDVLSVRGNIAIVSVALSEAESISSLQSVKAMSLNKKVLPSMDVARATSGVDLIHQGNSEKGVAVPYTGAGIITAVVDQGVDAQHINFRLPDNRSRIGYLAHLRYNAAGTGITQTHYYETNIDDFSTDDPTAYHGTHTLGILAGGYDGPVSVGNPDGQQKPGDYIIENCKYYGTAPGSNIAVSCGDLTDGLIALGMDHLLGYAEYQERPIVYSLSLGSNFGPHDPQSQMSQYLDEIGENGIICISAGNEGDLKITLKKTFTEENTSFKTLIHPYLYRYDANDPESYTMRYGTVAIYSNDDTPFSLQAVIYNKKRDYRPAMRMPLVGDNIGTYYVSSSDYQMDSSDIIGDTNFKKAFNGYVGVGGKIDEQTGRYYGLVDFYTINNMATNLDDDYVLGFEVEGVPGQIIECYNDGVTTWLENYGLEGFTDGSMDGTISDLAVGHNLLVVGSYNTRQNWTCLDGSASGYTGNGFTPGEISAFSSFGTLSDGRELPHVCAPGAAIVSSISWPYAKLVSEQYGDGYLENMCQAKLEEDNRTNYWKQEIGTSMSTPFVAGSIALWLEANPNLTIEEVKDIIAKTSIRDEQVEATNEQTRWGAGKFDALAGLKEAIRMTSGVKGINADINNDRLILTREGNRSLKVFVGGTNKLTIQVFAMDGRIVYSDLASEDETTVDLSTLSSGTYIITVNGCHSQKIVLK